MKIICIITGFLFLGTTIKAQEDKSEQITVVVHQFFKAMKDQDTVQLLAVLKPDAQFFTVVESKDGPKIYHEDAHDFIIAVGTPHKEIWDERIGELDLKVDGNLASVWMNYSFYLDGEFSHCGINVMQLFFDGQQWMIFEIADTRRFTECN